MKKVKIKLKDLAKWVSANQLEFALLLLILFIASFLRLYKIADYMTFLGDEGRDAIVVRRLLVDFDLIFIGPGTSVGNMYLGPFYYYLMAPFLLLWNFSPVGPAVMIALLGVATVFLIWLISRSLFNSNQKIAYGSLIAAFLYAINPTVIKLTKFSWNPNIMPFFSLIFVWCVWQFWSRRNYLWLAISGVIYGIMLQSHYMGAVMFLFFLPFWVLSFRKELLVGTKLGEFAKKSILGIIGFMAIMSPLLFFDAKHGFRNFKSLGYFLFTKDSTVSISASSFTNGFVARFNEVASSLFYFGHKNLAQFALFFTIVFTLWLIVRYKKIKQEKNPAYLMLIFWLLVGFIGLGVFHDRIFDHYYAFMFPAPFLLLGAVIDFENSLKKQSVFLVLFLTLAILVSYLSVNNSHLRYKPNNQLQRTELIAHKMIEESGGKSFNIAVISDNNYEGAYMYFLEREDADVKVIDPQKEMETVTEQLFVVCEYKDITKCQPTSNPKSEIANFGWSKVDTSWMFDSIVLFKLSHNKP